MKVLLITCTEVSNVSSFISSVKTAYPSARLSFGSPHTVIVAISGFNWTVGLASYFSDLLRRGIIGSFTHRQYTDWNEEVFW